MNRHRASHRVSFCLTSGSDSPPRLNCERIERGVGRDQAKLFQITLFERGWRERPRRSIFWRVASDFEECEGGVQLIARKPLIEVEDTAESLTGALRNGWLEGAWNP